MISGEVAKGQHPRIDIQNGDPCGGLRLLRVAMVSDPAAVLQHLRIDRCLAVPQQPRSLGSTFCRSTAASRDLTSENPGTLRTDVGMAVKSSPPLLAVRLRAV